MKKETKSLQMFFYAFIFLVMILVLFFVYTIQNKARIQEQNKNYAEDAMRQTARQIEYEFKNAQNLINTYEHFLETILEEPEVSIELLKDMEDNSVFDLIRFTDKNGITYASSGETSNSINRDYYIYGMEGKSGISVIFDAILSDGSAGARISFYAPVVLKGEIIGVIRGSYTAENYLKNMIYSTYFGEISDTFLCLPDGRVIASSNGKRYEENLIDTLLKDKIIDKNTANAAKDIFLNGGEGSFICGEGTKTDNLCLMYLPENNFVFVQTFPQNITQAMVSRANLAGIMLEIFLIILFAIYVAFLIIRARRQRKILEK